MAKNQCISISVIKRLPRYHRFLGELLTKGVKRISSRELAQTMKLTASQIRQDLNCFGGFGQQGYGYNVELLYHEIANILGLHDKVKTIVIGAGNLGKAIVNIDFNKLGFDLIGIFERDPLLQGTTINGQVVQCSQQIEHFCKENQVEVAVLCVPKESANTLVELLISLGIKAFWNYSHYDIGVYYDDIVVENVHLSDSLMTLSYRVKDFKKNNEIKF